MLINNQKVLWRAGDYALTRKDEEWFYIWQRYGHKFVRMGTCTVKELDNIMDMLDDLDWEADEIEADENP